MSLAPKTEVIEQLSERLDRSSGDVATLRAVAEELSHHTRSVTRERDEYKRLYQQLLVQYRKLEQGILAPKRERLPGDERQLTLTALLGLLTQAQSDREGAAEPAPADAATTEVGAHTRAKPTGRKPLPEHLPRIDIEILPEDVQQKGLDAFTRIGEDVAQTLERRPASLVVVRVHRPKFVPKNRVRAEATTVSQAEPPELPIPKGLAGPGLLAATLVQRFADHLPLHRQEQIYAREEVELARSTLCGWHMTLYELVKRVVDAMWKDALDSPYLCTDATGVLVQAADKCRRGHFWVVVAPSRHVLFRYSAKHNGAVVAQLFPGYRGYLVADAHAVYDQLFASGEIIEVAPASGIRPRRRGAC